MNARALQLLMVGILVGFLVGGRSTVCAQASNGQIEGTVVDQNGAVIAKAFLSVTNVETGAFRTVTTDESGFYRIPLLPLGTYRIVAEAQDFKRLVRDGVILTTGRAATVDLKLDPGEVQEIVNVSGDAPVADSGKTDLGRVMNDREVHSIPLPTRNPYNFVILQAGVTGRPNRGGLYPQINVNGFARRVNYLLDGSINTRGDRAGARIMMISETYVSEMQLLTPGFAAEFGNTTGMIVNMVTPAGTNDLRGSVLYLFNRPSFYARPFFFSAPELPDNEINNVAATIGGPIIKDRWQFYIGYENQKRDNNTRPNGQVRISEADKAALIGAGLPASIFVPSILQREYASHFIFRTDAQLNSTNRLAVRFNHSATRGENFIGGGFNTMERSVDVSIKDHSLGLQLVSFAQNVLNEFRFQFVRSNTSFARNANSGTGPSVTITNAANFGSPSGADTVDPLTKVTQIHDNFTWTRKSHAIKFGGGFSYIDNFSRSQIFSQFTFPSIAAYVAARNGTDPFGYTQYQESFGDPETIYKATYWNIFAQDDWKATRRLKFTYGLRYDLYRVPEADPSSLFPASKKFNTDSNNVAPRFGIVYALREGDRPLVLRAGAGIYYEPPWLDMYDRALLNNGDPKFFNLRFLGNNGGTQQPDPAAPAFPNTFSGSRPPGSALPTQDIVTIAPDFENMYAIHSNLQLEQAITDDLSVAVGYVHSGGRHIPVYRNINHIGPVRFLADGRPVFGPARLDPRFNVIQMAESAGGSRYDALTVQLAQRFSHGLQFAANYTLSRAVDDAPEQNVTYSVGGFGTSLVLSDPTNRALDKGYSYGDQRHTFVMSLVARLQFNHRNRTLRYLFNNNQIGIISRANSGERFSIVSNFDLNRDGLLSSDRPVGIKRNSGKTPAQFNLDLRYSRFFNFGERFRLETFGEFQNFFNINRIVAFNDLSVPTNPVTGELIGPLTDFKARNQSTSQESRQIQLGLKFRF